MYSKSEMIIYLEGQLQATTVELDNAAQKSALLKKDAAAAHSECKRLSDDLEIMKAKLSGTQAQLRHAQEECQWYKDFYMRQVNAQVKASNAGVPAGGGCVTPITKSAAAATNSTPLRNAPDEMQSLGNLFESSMNLGTPVQKSDKFMWEQRIRELEAFRATYGHASVPSFFPPNQQLANWVSTQRTTYKLYEKGEKTPMTKQRISRLENLGFAWSYEVTPKKPKSPRASLIAPANIPSTNLVVPQIPM